MDSKDQKRIIELLDESFATRHSIEETLVRIVKDMPHLSSEDIQEAVAVHAEESKLDASVHKAQAAASHKMAEILTEIMRISERAHMTTEEAMGELIARAQQGDKRATEMLVEFNKAALVIGLDD